VSTISKNSGRPGRLHGKGSLSENCINTTTQTYSYEGDTARGDGGSNDDSSRGGGIYRDGPDRAGFGNFGPAPVKYRCGMIERIKSEHTVPHTDFVGGCDTFGSTASVHDHVH